MRTPTELRELIQLILIEEMNKMNFDALRSEPENIVPKFIEDISNRLAEVCSDEIIFRRKY